VDHGCRYLFYHLLSHLKVEPEIGTPAKEKGLIRQ
jgi:hypothetical protein